jgi:transcriptional regulator with XRE-family HTH domain
METFEQVWRRLAGGLSLRKVAGLAAIDPGHLSRVVRGHRPATPEIASALDQALGTGGRFVAALATGAAGRSGRPADVRPGETAELVRRLRVSAIDPATIDALHATVFELCCQYPHRSASSLRAETHSWLREVTRLLRLPVGLGAHRELLTVGGWLALLAGCVEYDLGVRAGAEATRVAAQQLGREGGNAEIVAWAYEMQAWFALTQSRWHDVDRSARAGQHAAPSGSAAIQLAGQQAKANARLGDVGAAREALDRGRGMLDARPYPDRPDHHFVVDPDKWDFYAMDACRAAGDDEPAVRHAENVIARSDSPDGERSPMRAAEARLTIAAVAARRGDLDQAVATGLRALDGERRSLPSLLMVGAELDRDLRRRHPREPGTAEFHEALHSLNIAN